MCLHLQLENYRSYGDFLHIKRLLYSWRCLFSVLELDVRYEWQVVSPNMHCSLFLRSHLFVYSCIRHILETFRSYVYVQHIERLLYYWRYSLCGLELHERSNWRATTPDMLWSFSDTTLCANTPSPYIHRYLVCNYA